MWTAEGQIQFLGRVDSQVKVNGLRIELDEIDGALLGHPRIHQAATIVVERADGIRRLVAHLRCDWERPPVQELRTHLKSTLPDYLIPSEFVAVPEIPMTKAGKTDRAALAVPAHDHRDAPAARAFVPPRTEDERRVAAVLGTALGRPVGMRDDLYVGVDRAATAVFLADRLSEHWQTPVAPSAVYRQDTPEDLCGLAAAAVDRATAPDGSAAPDSAGAGSLESVLLRLWSEALQCPVRPDDDFFALGGYSMLAAQLCAQIRDLCQVELPLTAFFEAPTVRELAAAITSLGAGDDQRYQPIAAEVPPASLAGLLDEIEHLSDEEAAALAAETEQ